MGQSKPGLEITHLSGNFYVYTTYSLYKDAYVSANCMYLVTNKGVVLFDTPWDPDEYQPLLDSIQKRHQQKVIMVIATHSHEDRAGGIGFYNKKGLKTYTSNKTDQILKLAGKARARHTFKSDTTFSAGQYRFQAYYAGEGHTKDNIVIWFEKERILYGGCLVKSTEATGLGFTGEANLAEWPKTIRKLQQKFPDPAYIITGHDGWSGTRSLDHTLELLEAN